MKEIRDLIIYLSKEKNKTVFLSSHILHEVEIIASRMIILNKGAAQVEGTVDELLKSDRITVTFEIDKIQEAMEIAANVTKKERFKSSNKNEITFDLSKEEIINLNKVFVEKGISVSAIIPEHSLEDYFLKITEGGEK